VENIAQIHSKLDKMPDVYLADLIKNNSPFATVAAMVLDNRQNMIESMATAPTSTVADKVAGVGSIPINQDNSDPRLMAGVGGMPITPRDSVDTPMTGVARLPAKQMMAEGGIVGYQEGGDVTYFGRDGQIFDTTNPLDYAMAIPGLGVGYGAARLGYKGLKALPALGRTLNPSGGFRNLKTALGRRQLGKATKGSKTDTELRSRTMKGRRDPETGRIRSDEAIGAGVLAPYARYGSGAAGLGALGYFGSGLLPEGSEKVADAPVDEEGKPIITERSPFDSEGFKRSMFGALQRAGGKIATGKEGITQSFATGIAEQAKEEQKQENLLAALGVKNAAAMAKLSSVTPAERINLQELLLDYRTQFLPQDVDRVYNASEPSELSVLLGGVTGEDNIKLALERRLMEDYANQTLGIGSGGIAGANPYSGFSLTR